MESASATASHAPANWWRSEAESLFPFASSASMEEFHLHAVSSKFSQLVPRLSALRKRAESRGVHEIKVLEDIVSLLFPHTLYKSYPLSWLDHGCFAELTTWLGSLTTIDLSGVRTQGVECIDEWLDELDRTQLQVIHTFGTSGKLSFIPRTRAEFQSAGRGILRCLRDWPREGGVDLFAHPLPIVQPYFRRGANAITRGVANLVELLGLQDKDIRYLYPDDRFSADVASIAGRLRGLESSGGQFIEVAPRIQARREHFAAMERERPARAAAFFRQVCAEFGGKDIYLFGVWPTLFDWAQEGLASGIREVFGGGSILHTGGGLKGRALPENWQSRIFEFLGFDRHFEVYAMSELLPACPACERGHWHVPAAIVPFVLEPGTTRCLPRSGRQRGQFAFFDLTAVAYWGGFISGDDVTLVSPDSPCACGRAGWHLEPDISRLSAREGGDDKVSCADTADAHNRATEYIATAG